MHSRSFNLPPFLLAAQLFKQIRKGAFLAAGDTDCQKVAVVITLLREPVRLRLFALLSHLYQTKIGRTQ